MVGESHDIATGSDVIGVMFILREAAGCHGNLRRDDLVGVVFLPVGERGIAVCVCTVRRV